MPFVKAGDINMYYEEHGEGFPVIWIPGTGNSGEVWKRYQIPAFLDHFRCILVDPRGAGQSDKPVRPSYTVHMLARDMLAFCNELGLAQADFVGFSLGSAIIQELALAAPRLVRRAVLLSTWSSTPREHHIRRHYEARLLALERAPLEVFRAFAFWMWAPSFVDDHPDEMAASEQFFGEVAASMTLDSYKNHFRADLSHDALDRLDGIQARCLVVYGQEDLITLPRYNRRVAERIPNCELEEIEGAGHIAWGEKPNAVNDAILRFLSD